MKWCSLLFACLINAFFVAFIFFGGPKEAHSLSLSENGEYVLMAFNIIADAKTREETVVEKTTIVSKKVIADIQEPVPFEPMIKPQKNDEATVITVQESEQKIEKNSDERIQTIVKNIAEKPAKKNDINRVEKKPKTTVQSIPSKTTQKNIATHTQQHSKRAVGTTHPSNASRDAGFANGTNQASLIGRVKQCYPKISQKRGEEGVAEVAVRIGENNNIIDVRLVKSTGFPRLDECALSAVRGAQFKSAMNNGRAIESTFKLQPIRFRI